MDAGGAAEATSEAGTGNSGDASSPRSPTLRHRGAGSPAASSSPQAQTPASSSTSSSDRMGLLKAFWKQQGGGGRRRPQQRSGEGLQGDPADIPEEERSGEMAVAMSPLDRQRQQQQLQQLQQEQTPQGLARLPSHARRDPYIAESHTFESDESEVWRVHEHQRRAGELFGAHSGRQRAFLRWALTALVGVLTELVCVFIIACSTTLADLKFAAVLRLLAPGRWYFSLAAFLVFLALCLGFAALACGMTLVEPASAGSGIAEVRAYLNGIEYPRVMRLRTLWTKVAGVIFAQASGLPLGFEGPIVHCGAIVGSCFSQGRGPVLGGVDMSALWRFEDFQNHKEKRDFVACGTAAGVAAAFGAPIGGVLFAMEEGASYWSLKMTWRCFFCAAITALLGFLMVRGLPTEWVAQFYFCDPFPSTQTLYGHQDLGVFALMGVAGGLLGATFNQLNRALTVLRLRHVTTPKRKLAEVLAIAGAMALLSFCVPFAGACKPQPPLDPATEIFTYASVLRPFTCADRGAYNELASLYFNAWDDSLRMLFHLPMHIEKGGAEPVFSTHALLGFFLPYFILAFITFGSSVPSGLFIPSLLSGAALGRIVGQSLHPLGGFAAPGVYALIGASAVLGGMTRMTISLALILLEATGNLYLLIPLGLSLMLSRWVGNFLNEGIYDMHIHLHKVPFLEPQCPKEARVNDLRACEIMATELQFLRPIERVGRVLDTLRAAGHNLFPLLEADHTVFGTVQRDTLCTLLSLRAFSQGTNVDTDVASDVPQSPLIPYRELERFFPAYPDIDSLDISREERQRWVDLRPYCNTAPFTINEAASVPRTYRLFRLLGMRHLLVVDRRGHLVGIITRHDLLEEHILAALQHSPLLRTKTVWTMRRPAEEGSGEGGRGVGGNAAGNGVASPASAAMP